jgi:hypothetical protein
MLGQAAGISGGQHGTIEREHTHYHLAGEDDCA